MNNTVYGTITKPKHCLWVMGLPTTKDDFYASQAKPTSEYTKRFWHWPEYRDHVIDDYGPLKILLDRLGVQLRENASIEDFRDAWQRDIRAVVLFSHWMGDGVELRDGKVTSLELARSIPSSAVATIDLCVCHPQNLVLVLEESHPLLLKKAIWVSAEPKYWFMFYSALFMHLSSHDMSYPSAVDEIASSFLMGAANIANSHVTANEFARKTGRAVL